MTTTEITRAEEAAQFILDLAAPEIVKLIKLIHERADEAGISDLDATGALAFELMETAGLLLQDVNRKQFRAMAGDAYDGAMMRLAAHDGAH